MSLGVLLGLGVILFEMSMHGLQHRFEPAWKTTLTRLAFPLSSFIALWVWLGTSWPLVSLGLGVSVYALCRFLALRHKTPWWFYLSLPGRVLVFYAAAYTFFVLTPPLTFLWMSLSVTAFFVGVTVLFAHHQLTHRFNVIPYRHTFAAQALQAWQDRLYLVQSKRMRLPMNALLFGYGNSAKIFFSPLLLGRLKSQHIAGIVAHEIGHQQHHHLLKRSFFLAGFVVILSTVGYTMMASNTPTVEEFASFTGAFIALMYGGKYGLIQLLHYQEFQADRFALKHGVQASLIGALETIERYHSSQTLSPWFVTTQLTHPLTHKRLSRLKLKEIL